MTPLNTVITRMVKDWIDRQKLSQSLLATRLQLSQPQLSKRLNCQVPWRLSEIDNLEELGAIDYQTFMQLWESSNEDS